MTKGGWSVWYKPLELPTWVIVIWVTTEASRIPQIKDRTFITLLSGLRRD